MFEKEALDKLFDDLKGHYGDHKDWEEILRQAHLGVAYSDADVSLAEKEIDPRVVEVIDRHRG
jgi:hypothetical protein